MRATIIATITPDDTFRVNRIPQDKYSPERVHVEISASLSLFFETADVARAHALGILRAIGEDYRAALADVIGYAESRVEDIEEEAEDGLGTDAAAEVAVRARAAVEHARKLLADHASPLAGAPAQVIPGTSGPRS